jgi:hypothetical protein
MGDQVVEFADEKLVCPEGFIARFLRKMCGGTASELVVEDDWNVVLGSEGSKMVMCCPAASMDGYHWRS